MINKRRTEFHIISDILELTQEKVCKNAILYKCNMSYNQQKKYLRFLISKNFISKEEGKYLITNKGNECLTNITNVLSYFGS